MKRLLSRKKTQDDKAAVTAAPAAAAKAKGPDEQIGDPQPEEEEQDVMSRAADEKQGTKGDAGVGMYKMLMEERKLRSQLRASGSAGEGAHLADAVASSATITSPKPKIVPGTVEAVDAVKKAQSQKVRQRRLMKELRDVKRSSAVKDGIFDAELVDDNLFEWDVWLKTFDKDSLLAKDLLELKKRTGIGDVWLRFSFPDNFPFDPPFVRVLAPLVAGGYVLSGGAICMELLTPDGWSSAYSVEAIIMQTMATMIKGEARVVHRTVRQYGEAEARRSYDYLVKTHKKYGWSTPPKGEG